MELAFQGSLFGSDEPHSDAAFTGAVRHALKEGAWVEHVAGWVTGGDGLFDELVEVVDWKSPRVHMYDRVLDQPRLSGGLPEELRPAVVDEMRGLLSERYAVDFTSVGVNLYRDGRDSVAWHGDRVARDSPHDTCIAIVSLGGRRRFLLRPKGGGASVRFELESGDLLVMGGSCQRTWQHCVPKVERADARMSVTFRHVH